MLSGECPGTCNTRNDSPNTSTASSPAKYSSASTFSTASPIPIDCNKTSKVNSGVISSKQYTRHPCSRFTRAASNT